jgi:ectoine hydroxylase-related dioxygenase (phytanoyl-CoA dioxygenase family)
MAWVVKVSANERSRGQLLPKTAEAAYQALTEHGCALLRDVFAEETIDAMYHEYLAQYGAVNAAEMAARADQPAPNPVYRVGESRYEITTRMNGAFGNPNVFANPLLRSFLAPLLGETMRLSGMTVVVSYPGSDLQHVHRDHPLLFGDCEESCNLPTYAINVTIPLIDVAAEMGPTGVWLGSHRRFGEGDPDRKDMTATPFRRGDCVLLDYRTLHAGLPNKSNVTRPIAYLVYTKTWFFDEINHVKRSPLGMTLAQYEALPEEMQPLLLRALSQHMRAKHVSALATP